MNHLIFEKRLQHKRQVPKKKIKDQKLNLEETGVISATKGNFENTKLEFVKRFMRILTAFIRKIACAEK